MPQLTFKNLWNPFESYIQIKQLNGQGTDITNNKLIELLMKHTYLVVTLDCKHLLSHLLKFTALEFASGRCNNVEGRCI